MSCELWIRDWKRTMHGVVHRCVVVFLFESCVKPLAVSDQSLSSPVANCFFKAPII